MEKGNIIGKMEKYMKVIMLTEKEKDMENIFMKKEIIMKDSG